jgi:prephenate dehydrogenase
MIGLGLIGGSIALGVKRAHPEIHIIGFDKSESSLIFAKKQGIIDEIANDLEKIAHSADIIFLCLPVKLGINFLNQLSEKNLKPHVLITDAGSTKVEITQQAEKLFQGTESIFIGGHPMAGSHKSGVSAADVDLFENAYYILTPTSTSGKEDIESLKTLLSGLHSKFIEMKPEEHDAVTSMVSHLPHIIAAGLVASSNNYSIEHPLTKLLAAGGFRDMTRIASSDPRMWTDILLSNRVQLLKQMQRWREMMSEVEAMIAKEESDKIYEYFDNAREIRTKMPIHKEGAIPAFYDLFVDVPDHPGSIHQVTGFLLNEEISLMNIKILETREEIAGVLQLSFKNRTDLKRAQQAIESQSEFRCYEL